MCVCVCVCVCVCACVCVCLNMNIDRTFFFIKRILKSCQKKLRSHLIVLVL